MENTISEMKNTLGGIYGRLDTVEEKISEFEDVAIEIIQNKASKGKNWRKKEQIFELWDNLKWHNINVIGVQKVGIGEKYLRKYWPKFFKFDQNENPPIQEAEHSPSSRNMKKKKNKTYKQQNKIS